MNCPASFVTNDSIFLLSKYKSNSCVAAKLFPLTLIDEPTFGFSGTILNSEFSSIPSPELCISDFVSVFTGFGRSSANVFPISNCLSFLSRAFQLIPGFSLSVFTPNLIDSPGFTNSFDVKIITPCGVFSPVHPLSVLKDLKLKSEPNHILKVLIGVSPLLVNSIIVVSSNAMLDASTDSAA